MEGFDERNRAGLKKFTIRWRLTGEGCLKSWEEVSDVVGP